MLASCGAEKAQIPKALDKTANTSPGEQTSDDFLPNAPSKGDFWKNLGDEELVELLLDGMSPEDMLAQVFMLGWSTPEPEGVIMDWLNKRQVGGVKIFGWNGSNPPRMARTLGIMQNLALRKGAGIPLLTATDQEGGWVRHIKGASSQTPGNLALGAGDNTRDAYLTGKFIAEELRVLGVNMNFAPTVDLYVNPLAHVIGPRAFSADAQASSELARAFFLGQEEARVISTAKHFPGHGNAEGDSHGVLPIIKDSLEVLNTRELVPFASLINDGIPAILVGHLNFPLISQDSKPASLSSKIIKGILRDKLKFDGLVITDDIFMGGAADYGTTMGWKIDRVILEALRAGNDMVMISRTPGLDDAVWTTSLEALRTDPEFAAQIRTSVSRVLRLKLRYLKDDKRVPLFPEQSDIAKNFPAPGAAEFFRDQAYRAVTVYRQGIIPLDPEKTGQVLLMGQDIDFLMLGRQHFSKSREFQFPYEPFYWASQASLQSAKEFAAQKGLIIFCLANPNSLEVLKTLEPYADRIVVLSTLSPIYLRELPWVNTAVAVYGWGQDSFRAGLDVLTGQYQARGIRAIP